MYNKYKGNSGLRQRVAEAGDTKRKSTPTVEAARPKPTVQVRPVSRGGDKRPPSPLSGLSGELGRMLAKLGSLSLETEDLLLILILYLLYRESGDQELLIAIGALIFL